MSSLGDKLAARRDTRARKRDAKRRDIADSAIDALKTYGYARTTLRDIAAQSGMSLGSLHYYFEDRDELLVYCVRQYKLRFVGMIASAVDGVGSPEQALEAFCRALAQTILDEADMHRLWYDIRNQALFDQNFVAVVEEIEALLVDMLAPLSAQQDERELLYLRLDGAFRYLLQQQLAGRARTVAEIQAYLKAAAGSIPSA